MNETGSATLQVISLTLNGDFFSKSVTTKIPADTLPAEVHKKRSGGVELSAKITNKQKQPRGSSDSHYGCDLANRSLILNRRLTGTLISSCMKSVLSRNVRRAGTGTRGRDRDRQSGGSSDSVFDLANRSLILNRRQTGILISFCTKSWDWDSRQRPGQAVRRIIRFRLWLGFGKSFPDFES